MKPQWDSATYPTRLATLKEPDTTKCGKDVEEPARSHVAVGMQTGTGIWKTVQKTIGRFSSFKLDIHLSYDPVAVLEKFKTYDHIKTCA